MHTDYFEPILALVSLTAIVMLMAVKNRVTEIRLKRIPVQSLARARDTANSLQDSQAMDNFNNLMQVPILFYVLCFCLDMTLPQGSVFIYAVWLYVILRIIHSAIQVTYNGVMHRFYIWMLSNVVLFGTWASFAIWYL